MDTAARYRRWATDEALGQSPTYERLALDVAGDERVVALLDTLPPEKRQPNLLFAAMRWHDAPYDTDWLVAHWTAVADVMRARRTQTNEVARCALLLPALATLPEPLALVEVGASAGLCLLYDRWAYDYDGIRVGSGRVTLPCRVSGGVPVPARVPEIVWRAGVDVSPLDPRDPDTRRWLECLVWPEHADRRATLHAALEVAAADPPRVVRGDLLRDLPALLDQAPRDATTVVVHSAALTYVDADAREAFVALLRERGVHRLGAEGPDVVPGLDPPQVTDRFVVSLDDRVLGLGQPHGRALDWL